MYSLNSSQIRGLHQNHFIAAKHNISTEISFSTEDSLYYRFSIETRHTRNSVVSRSILVTNFSSTRKSSEYSISWNSHPPNHHSISRCTLWLGELTFTSALKTTPIMSHHGSRNRSGVHHHWNFNHFRMYMKASQAPLPRNLVLAPRLSHSDVLRLLLHTKKRPNSATQECGRGRGNSDVVLVS